MYSHRFCRAMELRINIQIPFRLHGSLLAIRIRLPGQVDERLGRPQLHPRRLPRMGGPSTASIHGWSDLHLSFHIEAVVGEDGVKYHS